MNLWFTLVAFILTAPSGLALGDRQNTFDAAEAVGKADVIVVGHLSPDGTLVQASVLKGELEPAGMYALDACFYKSFRKLLLRWWVFLPELDERALLDACAGPSADSAKLLLAELWQKGRLSADIKRQLVHDFLRLRMVVRENPYPATSPKARVKPVVGDRQFPFPEASWVNQQGSFRAGREPDFQRENGGGSDFSLVGIGPRDFMTGIGLVDETDKVTLEISEIDYKVTPPAVLWRLRWDLKQGEDWKQGE